MTTETIHAPVALSAVLACFARSEPRSRRAIGCAVTFSGYDSLRCVGDRVFDFGVLGFDAGIVADPRVGDLAVVVDDEH